MSAPGTPPPAASAASSDAAAIPAGSELDRLFHEADAEHHDGEGHKKKHRRSKHPEKNVAELNLTAMMDMMTIILVFLIKNFATSPENTPMDKSIMQPPRSSAKVKMEPAVTITITKLGISVDDKPLADFDAPSSFKFKGEEPASSQPIQPLRDKLDAKVADLKKLEQLTSGQKPFEGKILVVADEKTPYSFLMRVLYTAGLAQFSQYKLVVRSKDQG